MSWKAEGDKIAAQNMIGAGVDFKPGDTFIMDGREFTLEKPHQIPEVTRLEDIERSGIYRYTPSAGAPQIVGMWTTTTKSQPWERQRLSLDGDLLARQVSFDNGKTWRDKPKPWRRVCPHCGGDCGQCRAN